MILCISATLPALSLRWVQEAHVERDRVQQQVDALRRTEALLVDAETGQRGFVITGKAEFLEPYRIAARALPEAFSSLHRQYAMESAEERRTIEPSTTGRTASSPNSPRRWRCASRAASRPSSRS